MTGDFDHLGLDVDHAIGPDHFALQRSPLHSGLDSFELPVGLDKTEVQVSAVQARTEQGLCLPTPGQSAPHALVALPRTTRIGLLARETET